MKNSKELCSLWNNEQEVQTGNVNISELHEFKGHPFRVEHDIQLFELSKSIEEKEVLVPLIVRPKGDWKHQIQPITNRLCEKCGLSIIPAEYGKDPVNMNRKQWEKEQSWGEFIEADAKYCRGVADKMRRFRRLDTTKEIFWRLIGAFQIESFPSRKQMYKYGLSRSETIGKL